MKTEKRLAIILLLGIMTITTMSAILSVQAGKDKNNDDNGKDQDNDHELTEYDVAVLCGASEDYEKNKEQCDKLYRLLEEGIIEDDPDFEYK